MHLKLANAQEEADRQNQTNQAVIGAMEQATEAITKLVGSNFTDSVLRTANGNNFEGINDYHLHEIMVVAISGRLQLQLFRTKHRPVGTHKTCPSRNSCIRVAVVYHACHI